ncbi:hypothetical protein PVAP13_7NG213151 [Panicum virgatum]|uniref:Uncharacterized protein n=1 Tax=Panicum virgatum TaxID=38727 RepID=A0A8T0Q4E0_PANVG|nr:hypothetical protein PVAP13_7NG213151 [Panicum virgatum]
MANLAQDKQSLEDRYKSLQEKSKSSTKKLKELKKFLETQDLIKDLAPERDLYRKELDELKATTRAVADMVDPPEKGIESSGTLLERMQKDP